jgi:hypothetical protein
VSEDCPGRPLPEEANSRRIQPRREAQSAKHGAGTRGEGRS